MAVLAYFIKFCTVDETLSPYLPRAAVNLDPKLWLSIPSFISAGLSTRNIANGFFIRSVIFFSCPRLGFFTPVRGKSDPDHLSSLTELSSDDPDSDSDNNKYLGDVISSGLIIWLADFSLLTSAISDDLWSMTRVTNYFTHLSTATNIII